MNTSASPDVTSRLARVWRVFDIATADYEKLRKYLSILKKGERILRAKGDTVQADALAREQHHLGEGVQ